MFLMIMKMMTMTMIAYISHVIDWRFLRVLSTYDIDTLLSKVQWHAIPEPNRSSL